MILADDNFATIIKAVSNGRTVYRNIRNAILFLLSGNLSAIITVLYTSLLALPIPFQAVQLLFINLVTDSLPALAIGMEPGSENALKQKPRNPKESIMNGEFIKLLCSQGLLIAVCVILAYRIGLRTDSSVACTMAFTTLTLARLFHGFNCRSTNSIFHIGFKGNLYSLGAFLLGVILVILVLFAPAVEGLFSVTAINGFQFGMILLLAVIPTVVIQLIKVIREHR